MLHEQNSPKNTWSRWLTPPVDMDKTVQKAPGADGLRRLWTWAKQCKKHLEQMAYAACGHGQTVQKAPGVDSKRRLWPCERSGGAKGFAPLQATCPPSPHLPGGLEHVRHLGPGRWLQVASAPPSHLHAPPRHTWRAGARAPPGRHFGNFIVRVLLNRNVLYTASAPRAAPRRASTVHSRNSTAQPAHDVGEADKALHGLVYRGSSDGVLSGSLLIGESDCSASAATAREQRSHRLLRRLQPHQTPARAGLKPQAYVDAGH